MSIINYRTLPSFKRHFRPDTVDEAVTILLQYGEDARILAGGTDLLVLMRSRKITPAYIVDINGIPELEGINLESGYLRIGALASLRSVELSVIVQKEFSVIAEAISQMASIKIRNTGTVAGNICRASPSADTAPPLMVLGALVEISGPDGSRRVVALEDFFVGPGITILKSHEILTAILIPRSAENSGTAFFRITRVAADLAKVNAAALLSLNNGLCRETRIALGGVAPTPIRARQAENLLKGKTLDEGIIEKAAWLAAAESQPITDVRSTEEYRRDLSQALVSQALITCLERVGEKEDI